MNSLEQEGRDKREHIRTPLHARIKIAHESFGERIVRTRDISMGGVFLLTDQVEMPPPGTVLQGQIQDDYGERPVVRMEIVRVEPQGVGLKFLE